LRGACDYANTAKDCIPQALSGPLVHIVVSAEESMLVKTESSLEDAMLLLRQSDTWSEQPAKLNM